MLRHVMSITRRLQGASCRILINLKLVVSDHWLYIYIYHSSSNRIISGQFGGAVNESGHIYNNTKNTWRGIDRNYLYNWWYTVGVWGYNCSESLETVACEPVSRFEETIRLSRKWVALNLATTAALTDSQQANKTRKKEENSKATDYMYIEATSVKQTRNEVKRINRSGKW